MKNLFCIVKFIQKYMINQVYIYIYYKVAFLAKMPTKSPTANVLPTKMRRSHFCQVANMPAYHLIHIHIDTTFILNRKDRYIETKHNLLNS